MAKQTMTAVEYRRKREAYAISSAPIEVKEKAIAALDKAYFGSQEALQLIEDSQPDYSDIGND